MGVGAFQILGRPTLKRYIDQKKSARYARKENIYRAYWLTKTHLNYKNITEYSTILHVLI